MKKIFMFFALALFVWACRTIPYTGRKQFLLITEWEETNLGIQAYEAALKKTKPSNNMAEIAMVEEAGKRIARAAEKPEYKWEFRLIEDDKTINAFALPGGKVAFYSGIIPICQTEAGVAVVMGHEVAHAIARHGGERISQGVLADLGMDALSMALRKQDPYVQRGVLTAFGLGVTVGALLPFSRKHESEADRIGLIFMAKAGYDPREAVAFWKRMEEKSRNEEKPPQFLSTHPSHETRIRQLEEWMSEAMTHYQSAPKR